jgi:dTDP-4-amino-4,6-dideoxygalactose transaminase
MSVQTQIPILDLQPQIQAHWDEFNAAFQRVMRSGQFILGPEEKAFEQECAAYLGVKHAIGLNSGTDALYIALRALNIGPGDEVITTPFTFFATAEAISHVGATPVFVDIEEDTFNIDPALIPAAITARTKAIIPVHLFGRPCDLDRIQAVADKHGLKIVEDCAQSFGATWKGRKVGIMGAFGCFSFFPTKNLSAFGDGGMITTDDDELAATARMLRVHGSRKKYFNEAVGYNSRLDELQAAMLRVKLPHIDLWNEGRRQVALRYGDLFKENDQIVAPTVVEGHVFHQYTVRVKGRDRDTLQAQLAAAGIGTMVYYPVPCHRLKLYQSSHAQVSCPLAEAASVEVLSLPVWPELPSSLQARTVKTIIQCL